MRSAPAKYRLAPQLLVAAGLILPSPALGQQSNGQSRVDTWQPATTFSPFSRVEGPRGSWAWEDGIEFGVGMSMEYLLRPIRATTTGGTLEQDGVETYPVEHALLARVGASLSPLDWLVVDLNMPFALYEGGATNGAVAQQVAEAGQSGWGDTRVGLGLLALNGESFDVTIATRVWLPWGRTASYLAGDDRVSRWDLGLSFAGEADVAVYGCGLALAPLFFGGRDGDSLSASCAAQFAVTPEFALGVEPHFGLYTFAPPTEKEGQQSTFPGLADNDFLWQLEPLAAARIHVGPFALGLFGGPGIGNAPGTGAARIMLSASYTAIQEPVVVEPPPPDADVDGIPDEFDQCPQQAGTEAKQGCPDELDEDGDGVVEDDACPSKPGARSDDPKANGCPDSDNDHVADPVDECPIEPGPQENGCPVYARLEGVDSAKGPTFQVKPPIKFDRRSAELSADSIAAIKEIVATMRANPKLKQVSFQVGAKRTSQVLTDKRAGAILTILAQDQDFDSNRYEVVLSDDLEGGAVRLHIVK